MAWCWIQVGAVVEVLILVIESVQISVLIYILLILSKELVEIIIWLILFFGKSFLDVLILSEQFVLGIRLFYGSSETLHVLYWRLFLCKIHILVVLYWRCILTNRWTRVDLFWLRNLLFVHHFLCESSTIWLILLLLLRKLCFLFYLLRNFCFLFFLLLLWWRSVNNIFLRFIIQNTILGADGIIFFNSSSLLGLLGNI